jgi:hypothetical protein
VHVISTSNPRKEQHPNGVSPPTEAKNTWGEGAFESPIARMQRLGEENAALIEEADDNFKMAQENWALYTKAREEAERCQEAEMRE